MTELKPCPFCGSTSISVEGDSYGIRSLRCRGCKIVVYVDLERIWNKRSEEE